MSIKKLDDGRYELDMRPRGSNGTRLRRIFDRKADAVAFERYTLANSFGKEGTGKQDRRALSELLGDWWLYHGQNHKNGETERRQLRKTIAGIGDIPANKLTKRMLMEYRSKRLADGISAATINRDVYRLSGMFSMLIRLEEYRGDNPAHGLPPLIEKNPGMTFLDNNEIAALLSTLTGDYRLIALVCLSTGGRWGEVSTLRPAQMVNGRITFLETKNYKPRVIPISDALEDEVRTKASGKLFKVDYERFCKLLRQVKPDLPRGQATHVLRHTFASHFMMRGGNIIALQKILGHASIQQTMSYAHLAPDYLQHAVLLNPLGGGIG
ncbi:tyrosine-type recombinase/integrase [Klebsiella oxytoca]|uniref:phage integrase n=1 Tax=Klebsiella oxytoca TaxID=571 RepID=UPI0025512779|nr:tyrosine-type recombinase/integrase [Klebsiella oxytoca]MDK8001092.1 tyrosine-type recombinase/integrase [Klebsiella oxytoca]MDK8044113.1 tyrosine-type recombinase/integrase [Klebsiella oxytoca]MDU7173312.1 tyrosine-type recombinase/integrase [Klebsiella oxytoca]HEJ9370890.1 tyrosine-type recombinase/integrase [Klebsiella oxytoca]